MKYNIQQQIVEGTPEEIALYQVAFMKLHRQDPRNAVKSMNLLLDKLNAAVTPKVKGDAGN